MGTIVLNLSKALGPVESFEVESGTLVNVTQISDSSASAGRAVQFGSMAVPLSCDLNATTSNFSTQISAATSGQSIFLATGNYGTFSGTNKPITITKQQGAIPSMSISFGSNDANFTLDGITITGGNISGSSANYSATTNPKNITIKNSTFTDPLNIEYVTNSNIMLDNNTHSNINNNSSCTGAPARIWLSYSSDIPSGVTIQIHYLKVATRTAYRLAQDSRR